MKMFIHRPSDKCFCAVYQGAPLPHEQDCPMIGEAVQLLQGLELTPTLALVCIEVFLRALPHGEGIRLEIVL